LGHGIRNEKSWITKKIFGCKPEDSTKVRRPTLRWLVYVDIDFMRGESEEMEAKGK
jgi:hypothetical protein